MTTVFPDCGASFLLMITVVITTIINGVVDVGL